jgi:hypothetical protein
MKVYDGSAWNIAAISSASPTFTGTVTIPTADINGGTIDGTVIGVLLRRLGLLRLVSLIQALT